MHVALTLPPVRHGGQTDQQTARLHLLQFWMIPWQTARQFLPWGQSECRRAARCTGLLYSSVFIDLRSGVASGRGRDAVLLLKSKMRQKCVEHLWGGTPCGRYQKTTVSKEAYMQAGSLQLQAEKMHPHHNDHDDVSEDCCSEARGGIEIRYGSWRMVKHEVTRRPLAECTKMP